MADGMVGMERIPTTPAEADTHLLVRVGRQARVGESEVRVPDLPLAQDVPCTGVEADDLDVGVRESATARRRPREPDLGAVVLVATRGTEDGAARKPARRLSQSVRSGASEE
jgi:hypothetical protein